MAMPTTVSCPTRGAWRAWMDGEHAIAAAQAHLAACPRCTETLDELRADAHAVATALDVLVAEPTMDALVAEPTMDALVAEPTRAAAGRKGPASAGPAASHDPGSHPRDDVEVFDRDGRRQRRALRWLSVAATVGLLAVLVGTPGGRSFASSVLSQFRSERVALVEVPSADARSAAEVMAQLGNVDGTIDPPEVQTVSDVAAAEAIVGFGLAVPRSGDLPAGVPDVPQVRVSSGHDVVFTFSAERTLTYLRSQDASADLPAGFDGARLVLHLPAAALLEYPGADGGPGLLVATAQPVRAEVLGGLSMESLRSFLLDLPGIPASLSQQLRAIDDWSATLAIPMPVDLVKAEPTTVAGFDALVVEQPGLGAGMLWQQDERIVGLAAPLDSEQVADLAETLAADLTAAATARQR